MTHVHFHRTRIGKQRILAVALMLFLGIGPLVPYFSTLKAGTFTNASLTISDSRAAGTSVTYDYAFTTTETTAIKQVDIQFCTTPTGACSAPTGLNTGSPTLASDNLAGTGRTTTQPSGNNTARVVVTTPAAQSTQAVTMSFTVVTNPSTTNASYYARVTTYSDTGSTVIDSISMGAAVLDTTSIAVSAQVGSTFTFSVAAATTGSVNGASINVSDSTATTIPFGVLSSGSTKIAAHDVSVFTNSTNGYSVTVKALADPPLVDGSNNIDAFSGTNSTPTTWSSPAGSAANVNTGFFGYTTNDATLGTGTASRFTASGGNKWAGTTTSPLEVAYSAAGVPSAEVTRVGWQAEVNGLQPPGTYTGTVILVATPTY
jgi:hypothetical protein